MLYGSALILPLSYVQLECYDWDKHSSHDLIGTCTFTPNQLLRGLNSIEACS